jgi:pimeloyl-ACP methyl ester carboxylesterase
MGRLRKAWPVVRRVWITAGLSATVVFVTWSLIAYRANDEARQAARSDGVVRVVRTDGVWRFEPTGAVAPGPTLVFFPGGLVDPRAYAPLARAVARAGHRVVLVELPRRGAFGGADSPKLTARIRSSLALVGGAFVLGGHSRGAVVASRVAAGGAPRLAGLVLIGTSHPRDYDLSSLGVPVTKIVGTRDGLATPAKVRQNAALLPPQTRWVWVEGGNHSQFGWYGFQPLDRWARVDARTQRQIMIDAVLDLLHDADPGEAISAGPFHR